MNEGSRDAIFTRADLELVRAGNRYFIRYDAGSHQVIMREDEITESEAHLIQSGTEAMTEVLLSLQRRLIAKGIDPYVSNFPHA